MRCLGVQNRGEVLEAAERECWTEGGPLVGTFSLSADFVRSFITPLFDKYRRRRHFDAPLADDVPRCRLEVLKNWQVLSASLRQEIAKGDAADSRLNLILQVLDSGIQLLTDDKLRATRGRQRRGEADEKFRQEMTSQILDSMAQWIDAFQMDRTKVIEPAATRSAATLLYLDRWRV